MSYSVRIVLYAMFHWQMYVLLVLGRCALDCIIMLLADL